MNSTFGSGGLTLFTFVICGSVLVLLDVIANSLSSVADITSESAMDTAFLWSKGDGEETFVKASLAVLN
jgi:hypothetical protein